MSQLPSVPASSTVAAVAPPVTPSPATATTLSPSLVPPSALQLPANFPAVLAPQESSAVLQRVQGFDLMALAPAEIAKLGFESELALNQVFDRFLSAVDKQKTPVMFRLLDQLNGAVEAEKLDQLADRILSGDRPSLMTRLTGMLSAQSMRAAVNKALAETAQLVSLKTRRLSDEVGKLEAQLTGEMRNLETDMRGLDQVLQEYSRFRNRFAVDALFLHNALLYARQQVDALAPAMETDHLLRMQATQKLQALESRALAVEGCMTRLPADQLVLAQIQDAGMSTLQELATTASVRFASIKSSLLSLYSAYRVLEAQQLAQKGKDLDDNLNRMRDKLMHQVASTAAHAPGDNRLAQAQQIQTVVASTRELMELSMRARDTNQQKFDQARELLAASRQEMLSLGQTVLSSAQARMG